MFQTFFLQRNTQRARKTFPQRGQYHPDLCDYKTFEAQHCHLCGKYFNTKKNKNNKALAKKHKVNFGSKLKISKIQKLLGTPWASIKTTSPIKLSKTRPFEYTYAVLDEI